MDAAGIDLQVLSHAQPAAQALSAAAIAARAASPPPGGPTTTWPRRSAAHPARLAGFATLPTGSPAAAADELSRAVGELGFAGGLVNSTLGTNGLFLDDPSFAPLLARFEALDVPLYLHPAPPPAACGPRSTAGCPRRRRARSPPTPGAGTRRRGCTRCGWWCRARSTGIRGCG